VLQLLHTSRIGRRVEPELRDDFGVIAARPRWVYYRIRDDAIEVVSLKHYRHEDALRAE
jgi:plasmid stabilization system protein ParE